MLSTIYFKVQQSQRKPAKRERQPKRDARRGGAGSQLLTWVTLNSVTRSIFGHGRAETFSQLPASRSASLSRSLSCVCWVTSAARFHLFPNYKHAANAIPGSQSLRIEVLLLLRGACEQDDVLSAKSLLNSSLSIRYVMGTRRRTQSKSNHSGCYILAT